MNSVADDSRTAIIDCLKQIVWTSSMYFKFLSDANTNATSSSGPPTENPPKQSVFFKKQLRQTSLEIWK